MRAEIENLMDIVEGVRGERWVANGRRLVDTPEWCAFYTAVKREQRKEPTCTDAPARIATTVVDGD